MNATTLSSLKLFAKRLLVILFFYQLCRIAFYIYNYSFFVDSLDWKVWLGGMRFDLSVIGYVNLLFALLHLVPGSFQTNKFYQKFLLYSFYCVNTFVISLNFIDFEYFKFIGRRSSYGMITASGMENEIWGLLQSFVVDYWQIPVLMLVFAILIGFSLKAINYRSVNSRFTWGALGICLLSVAVLFVCGRGGFQKKPLRIVDASTYSQIGTTALVLNTPFTVLKTIGKKETLEDVHFFSDEESNAIFNPIQEFHHETPNKKNVVLLILESYGRENIQRGLTPFLDSLIQKSYFFENGFANGKLSIDAVPSTISSIPSLMNNSYISSSYSVNKVYALPEILKDHGYQTAFFHGAFNGSQNFDQYADVAGFDQYYGKDEYKGPESFDGKWGVFDEDFLQFFAKELQQFKAPFFATLFTISSHAPFTIPEKYKNKFPKGTTPIHESVAYTDYALKQFFKTASTMPWYKETIFIITSDHTSSFGEEPQYKNNIGKFKIPILFFAPGDPELVGVVEKNFQQIDILPSLMDYLQLNTKIISYGKSYRSNKDFVVNYLDNVYNYEKGDYYLAFDGKKSLGLFNWKTDPLLKTNLMESHPEQLKEMETFIKAYIQSFNKRVRENKLTVEK
ncbi:LTA synthase family protein [Flavobacterium sp. HSC-61S13]|uniref:LTA synthase family protein n=1 Tax=Flavobacterium sp. HSC-61S13 TaxID=2910963 RepID=UPI0020A143E0|nr:LTA synthase family protein [Flavobacterium sp. HSC-61S13]MCP1995731.1 phosphoglycerol transferase MdoB-like AlkP superfamily enzyme [Flavobacterium sp. HSC-61S13]